MQWLKMRDARRLVRYVSGRTKPVAQFLLLTGARVSEALRLSVKDIDWGQSIVWIPTLKRRTPGKRPYPLTSSLRSMLKAACEGKRQRHRVFPVSRQAVHKALKRAGRKAHLPLHLCHAHTLRHTYAMHLTMKGVPAAIIQRLLGHAKLTSTQVYVEHAALPELAEWVKKALGEDEA